MGIIGWIVDKTSSWGQPKEVREALKEGAKAIKADKEKFAKNSKPMPRGERKQLQKEVKKEMAALKKLEKKAIKDNKKELVAMKQNAVENIWFAKGDEMNSAREDVESIREMQGVSKKHMETDVREIQTMSALLKEMSANVKEAEQVSIRAAQAITAQENEIDRLRKLLEERVEISKQVTEIINRKMQGEMNKQLDRQHSAFIKQLSKKDREVLATFQRITSSASPGSALTSDIEFILQLLSPVEKTAPEMTKKVKDEMKQARDLRTLQGAILSAMKPAMKAKKSEIEMISIFVEQLDKAA